MSKQKSFRIQKKEHQQSVKNNPITQDNNKNTGCGQIKNAQEFCKFSYVIISHRVMKNIYFQDSQLILKQIQIAKKVTIGNLIEIIKQKQHLNNKQIVRLYRNNIQQLKVKKLTKKLKKCLKIHYQIPALIMQEENKKQDVVYSNNFNNTPYINRCDCSLDQPIFNTNKAEPNQVNSIQIGQLGLQESCYFVVEAYQHLYGCIFVDKNTLTCSLCFRPTSQPVFCICGVKYCSDRCLRRNQTHHLQSCQASASSPQMKLTTYSKLGMVGLKNIGNTCFMNSCLQCLSHTLQLTNYFLYGFFRKQKQKGLGFGGPIQGRLVSSYARLIEATWCGSNKVANTRDLKNCIARVNQMFSGFSQHDSHQFFIYLVDGIHQDLNRTKGSSYKQKKQKIRPFQNKSLSKQCQSWRNFLVDNQSVITDIMTGQYKSELTCLSCKNKSTKYQPFYAISLPIPHLVSFYILHKDTKMQPIRVQIYIYGIERHIEYDGKKLLKQMCQQIGRQPKDFGLYVLGCEIESQVIDVLTLDSQGICQILEGKYQTDDRIVHKHMFLIQLSQRQKSILQSDKININIVFCQIQQQQSGQSNLLSLWLKRPFIFQKNDQAQDVYRALLSYMFGIYKNNGYNQVQPKEYSIYEEQMINQMPFKLYIKSLDGGQARMIQLDEIVEDFIQQSAYTDFWIQARFQSNHYYNFQYLKRYIQNIPYNSDIKTASQFINKIPLDQCFKYFQQKQLLTQDNKYKCLTCGKQTQAFKQMRIYKAPQIMIIHLKRFRKYVVRRKSGQVERTEKNRKDKNNVKKQTIRIRSEKNQDFVWFPQYIDMKNYVDDQSDMSSYSNELFNSGVYIESQYDPKQSYNVNKPTVNSDHKQKGCLYQLYAINNHKGSLQSGHYTACVKNLNGKWYQFDDERVNEIKNPQFDGSAAYMLFYRKLLSSTNQTKD